MENSEVAVETLVKFDDLPLPSKSEILSNRNVEELQKVADRLHRLAEYLRHLYDTMVEFVHGKAMLRDLGDGVAKAMNQFGQLDQLPVPTSTNYTMMLLGDTVLTVGDKMDAEINHIETKIFPIFVSFGTAFKAMKYQIQVARQMEDQHAAKRVDFGRFLEKGKIIDEEKFAEREEYLRQKLSHAMNQSSVTRRKCVKKLSKLEKKKCEDLKKIMFKWFQTQASGAATTLELSTTACGLAKSIDTSGDINKLFKHLNLLDSVISKTEYPSQIDNEVVIEAGGAESNHDIVPVTRPTPLTFTKNDHLASGDSTKSRRKKSKTKVKPR